MPRTKIIPDGCDITIYDSNGYMIGEYTDVPKDIAAKSLNRLNEEMRKNNEITLVKTRLS